MTTIRSFAHSFTKSLPKCAFAALAILISGCASGPSSRGVVQQKPASVISPDTYRSLEQQLIEASRTAYPVRAELTLPITLELLKASPARAKELLDDMPYEELPPSLQAQLSLQQAMIAEASNQNSEVFSWLDREAVIASTDNHLQAQAHILRALAYTRFGEHQAALDEWLAGLPTLPSQEQTQYQDAFWQTLLHTSTERLQELQVQTPSRYFQGWLTLALIYQPGKTLEQQLTSLQNWQQDWLSHPANAYLPQNLDSLRNSTLQRPNQIAVLLPLSGGLSKAGQSVRDGMIAAHYEALNADEPTPELKFYDTTDTTINDLASQAIEEGAQLIIGPLTKSDVAQLDSDTTSRVPVLALNYRDEPNNDTRTSRLYQFGLSAEDEARMAALRGYLDGHRRAIVITPDTEWGQKISSTFTEAWIELGGEIAGETPFPSKTEFSQLAGKALHTDQSQARARQLNRQLGTKTGFRPRRRQDVDMIFMGVTPQEARQLKPALAYQFAGDIPVYSTSSAFSGKTNPTQDQDMDGIRIPIMPWVIPGVETRLEQKITRLWPQSQGQYGTLFALGADAYRLYPHLQQLSALQGSQVQGLTGRLSITPTGKIQRELSWQVFRNGRLRPLPSNRQTATPTGITQLNHVLAAKDQQ